MADPKHLGAFLKARREEMGTDLQDVESALSIKSVYLKAIEEGRLNQIISTAYARGFIKQYANFLGIDGERIVRENSHFFQNKKEKFEYGIGSIERRSQMSSSSRLISGVFVLALVGILGVIAWQLMRHFGKL